MYAELVTSDGEVPPKASTGEFAAAVGELDTIELSERFEERMERIENGKANEAVFAEVMGFPPTFFIKFIGNVHDPAYRYVNPSSSFGKEQRGVFLTLFSDKPRVPVRRALHGKAIFRLFRPINVRPVRVYQCHVQLRGKPAVVDFR